MFRIAHTIRFVLIVAAIALALVLCGAMIPFVPYTLRMVESGSMMPTIPTGSVVFISAVPNYTTGDIITFQRVEDERVTTHRIISERLEEGTEVFVVQGDANTVPDAHEVEAREVLGKVWAHIPYIGYVLNFFRQPIGFFVLVIIPTILIIIEQVRTIVSVARQQSGRSSSVEDISS